MTISLPQEIIDQVDQVRKAEHRSRSELVRDALRTYFSDKVEEAPLSPSSCVLFGAGARRSRGRRM